MREDGLLALFASETPKKARKKKNKERDYDAVLVGGERNGTFVKSLVHKIVTNAAIKTEAFSAEGYRNKILYGFDREALSPLACPEVNALCEHAFNWVRTKSRMPPGFWVEILVKMTLEKRFMVRFTFCANPETLSLWLDTEKDAFLEHILATFPAADCITYQSSEAKRCVKMGLLSRRLVS